MKIAKELICKEIGRNILSVLEYTETQYAEIADTMAIKALDEIKGVLHRHKELSDFEIVDEIVEIFIKYNISIGGCHDF